MELGKSDLKNWFEKRGKKKKPTGIQNGGQDRRSTENARTQEKEKCYARLHNTLYKPLTYSTLGKKGKPRLCKGYSRIRGKGTGGERREEKERGRSKGSIGKEEAEGGNRGECGRGVPPRPPAWPCCDAASRPSPVSFSYIVHFYFWSSVVLVRSLKFLFQGALTDIFS